MFYVLKTSDVLEVLVPILFHIHDSRTDPGECGWADRYPDVAARVGLIHMGVFLILLLSGERNFGVRLNKPFVSKGIINIPMFSGTHADLLIIVSGPRRRTASGLPQAHHHRQPQTAVAVRVSAHDRR